MEVRRRELQQALGPEDRGAYDRGAEVLLAMRPSYERLDERAGFDQLADEVRRSYRPRRLLLDRLDRAGLVDTREGP